ncbi:hypothetical protein [Amedibacillus sp. YH-ame10]
MNTKYTFKEYQEDIKLYEETSPFESSYQRVIENTLGDIVRYLKLELIISDKFSKNGTGYHDVTGYKKIGTASPDLMVTKGFLYHNKKDAIENKTIYYAYVEVKKPGTITFAEHEGKKDMNYTDHDRNQLQTYLSHPNGKKVIFTDGYTWVFYDGKFEDPKIIPLKENGVWNDDGRQWEKLLKLLAFFISVP